MLDPGPLLAHVFVFAATLGIACYGGKKAGVLAPTVVAYFAHLAVALAFYLTSGLWAPDAMHYDDLAQQFMAAWTGNRDLTPFVTAGKEGFPTLLAVLYGAFGHLPFVGILVNIAASTLVVPVSASAARLLGGQSTRQAAWLAGMFPSVLIWGSLLLREALTWLMLAVILRGLAGIVTQRGSVAWNWALAVLPILPLLTLRGTAALLLAPSIVLGYTIASRRRGISALVGLIGIAAAGPILVSAGQGIAGGIDLDSINRQREALAREASSSFAVTQYSSVGELIANVPGATLRGLFGPFPWELPGQSPFLLLDVVSWWALLALTVYSFRRRLTGGPEFFALLMPALTFIVVISITSGNYGTMARLRAQVAILLLPMAGHGLAHLARLVRQHAGAMPEARSPIRSRVRLSTADHSRA